MLKIEKNYVVWDDEEIIRGTAKEVLKAIWNKHSPDNEELAGMSLEEYRDVLIQDAPYFLPKNLLKSLKGEFTRNSYDLALACLAVDPVSQVRILNSSDSVANSHRRNVARQLKDTRISQRQARV